VKKELEDLILDFEGQLFFFCETKRLERKSPASSVLKEAAEKQPLFIKSTF
jgi:hypothetical protein